MFATFNTANPAARGGFLRPVRMSEEWRQRVAEECAERVRRVVLEVLARGLPTGPEEMLEMEATLHRRGCREGFDPVTMEVIQAAHEDPAVQEQALRLVLGSGVGAQRSSQEVTVTLLGGSQRKLRTPYCLKRRPRSPRRKHGEVESDPGPGRSRARGPGGSGLYPVLAVLGIQFRVTPALGCEVAREVALGTLEEARASLVARGVRLGEKTIERIAEQIAERALGYRQWCVEQAERMRVSEGWAKGKRLAIVLDGGRLRVRVNRRRGRPRKSGYPGFDAEWREPKVFVIYELDEQGRKKKKSLVYQDGTLGDADRLFELLAAALRQLGAQEAASWVILGDGGTWIWNRVEWLRKQLGYETAKVTEVLDFYHASQKVQELAAGLGGTEAEVKAHQRKARRLLRRGSIEQLLEWLGPCDYLETHRERLRYVRFRRRGLPIGSGAVESCVRRVVNLRMKGNSIYWGEAMAEAVLHLRSQLLAGRWREFVCQTLAYDRHPLFLNAEAA